MQIGMSEGKNKEKEIEQGNPITLEQASFVPKTPEPTHARNRGLSIGIFRKEDSSNHQPKANAGDASRNTVHEEKYVNISEETEIPEGDKGKAPERQ